LTLKDPSGTCPLAWPALVRGAIHKCVGKWYPQTCPEKRVSRLPMNEARTSYPLLGLCSMLVSPGLPLN
jgi:hypothetical protein